MFTVYQPGPADPSAVYGVVRLIPGHCPRVVCSSNTVEGAMNAARLQVRVTGATHLPFKLIDGELALVWRRTKRHLPCSTLAPQRRGGAAWRSVEKALVKGSETEAGAWTTALKRTRAAAAKAKRIAAGWTRPTGPRKGA